MPVDVSKLLGTIATVLNEVKRDDGVSISLTFEGGSQQSFVVPGHERRGVGHRLLDYAEGYAIVERAPTLRIVVEEENLRARDFYTRAGFAPVGKEIVERRLPAG